MQTEINFHNTVQLNQLDYQAADVKAYTQDQIILQFFQQNSNRDFTPCEVYETLIAAGTIDKRTPITSIRRAMCNLTTAKYLEKTQNKRTGIYGMVNFTWKLSTTN